MIKPATLSEIVEVMTGIGEVLVPFNFPKAPITLEDHLGIFKARDAEIDGYPLFLHYQKSDYNEYYIETLQIHNRRGPFLPFNLICKIGTKFLGTLNLSLIEIFRENRKIYIWSKCTDKKGHTIAVPNNSESETCEYEGLQYLYMQPSDVDFL